MEIKNLKATDLAEIVDCTLEAFKNYFVQMPASLTYWKSRHQGARVDYELSFGAFEDGKLIGFIINGIDEVDGKLTAFNTGTGVIEKYRGLKIVDQLYDFAMPYFKEKNVQQCQLEVIQENKRAIRVYERIGFEIKRNLKCFKGELKASNTNIDIHQTSFDKLGKVDHYYSWDHKNIAIQILSDKYECYGVWNEEGKSVGHFVINTEHDYLAQLETEHDDYESLLNGVCKISKALRIINVDERLEERIKMFEKFGLENNINQFEMEMEVV